MKKMHFLSSVLAICVSVPIWFYLLYRVLEAVRADNLMWFLYFVYLPVSLFVQIVAKLMESMKA